MFIQTYPRLKNCVLMLTNVCLELYCQIAIICWRDFYRTNLSRSRTTISVGVRTTLFYLQDLLI